MRNKKIKRGRQKEGDRKGIRGKVEIQEGNDKRSILIVYISPDSKTLTDWGIDIKTINPNSLKE